MDKIKQMEQIARNFAQAAHKGQMYGEFPYTHHLLSVRLVLADFGFENDQDLLIAAWLHDTLEDTTVTPDQLDLAFGSQVTRLVWAVTGVGKNRKERNECAYARIEAYGLRAVILKLADHIANVEACVASKDARLDMYRKEHRVFKERLYKINTLQCRENGTLGPTVESARIDRMWVRLEKALAHPKEA